MTRTALIAALSLVCLTACELENEPPKTAPPPFEWGSLDAAAATPVPSATAPSAADATDARVAALKKLDAALAAGDAKAYADLFAADAAVSVAGVSEWRGRDDVAAMHGKLFHAFDDVKVGSSRVILRRDRAAVDWTLTGVHARTWLGVGATSKPVAIQALTIYTFDADGRVKTAHVYLDVLSVLQQLGAALPGFDVGPVPKLPATTVVVTSQGTPEEDAHSALESGTATAIEQGNLDAATAHLADDVEAERLGSPTAKGREAARKRLEATFKATSERKVTIDGWAAAGFVVEEVTLNAINSGSFRGAAPTKKALTLHTASILEMKDKKVAHAWTFANRTELFSQLGVKIVR